MKKLKTLIKEADYTIEDFAKAIESHPDSVYRWIKRERNITLPNLLQVSRVLQTDLWDLAASLGYDMTDVPRATQQAIVSQTFQPKEAVKPCRTKSRKKDKKDQATPLTESQSSTMV